MNHAELAEKYIQLAMRYSEEHFVECGFAKATHYQHALIERIRANKVNRQDIAALESIFAIENIDVHEHLSVHKPWYQFW